MRKLKKSVSLLLTAILIAALLPAGTVFAAPGPDVNEYELVLDYRDSVQIEYIHNGGLGNPDWSDTVADVPIGGARLNGDTSISQLYCVDAVIPFHSRVVSTTGGTSVTQGAQTVDTAYGYVAVSPDNLKGVLKAHWNELLWLVINGYSGNYGAGASNDSVIALNNRYGNLSDNIGPLGRNGGHPIPEDVALMATKVAVWHFTNPDVAYVSTVFLKNSKGISGSPNGIKHRQFVALLKRLTDDAAAYAANPTPALGTTQMQLAVEKSPSYAGETPVGTVGSRYVYGPYRITDSSKILDDDDLVFLEATGLESVARYVGFYTMNGSGGFDTASLQSIQKYGEEDTYTGMAIEKDKDFYIGALPGDSLDGVSITALARATAEVKNMPVVLVHQDPVTGEQNWDTIQAFIGLSHNVPATVYGQAALPLSSSEGEIQVRKDTEYGEERTFTFKLTDSADVPVNLGKLEVQASGVSYSANIMMNASAGTFRLTAGQTVTFGALSLGDYKITEIDSKGFEVSYTTGSSLTMPVVGNDRGRTVPVSLHTANETAYVDFTNTSSTYSLSVVKRSSDPDILPLNGAKFSLTGPGYYEEETTDTVSLEQGILTFTGIPVPISETVPDVYTLSEISPPQDHLALNDVVFIEVSAAGVSIRAKEFSDENHVIHHSGGGPGGGDVGITVVNEYHSPPNPYIPTDPPPDYIVFVAKRSTSASNPLPALPDVTFTLEKDGESYEATTDYSDGTLYFDVSVLFDTGDPNDLNGTYTLTEKSQPANHTKLKDSVTFELTNGVGYTDISVTDPDDQASVTWLNLGEPTHRYLAFRIIDTYRPTGGSGNPPPQTPEPEKPVEPEEPEEPAPPVPETPDNPAPDNPDTHNPPDSPTPGGDRNIPQTGDDTNTVQWLLLLLLALCGAAAVWRLRGDGKRGAERQ